MNKRGRWLHGHTRPTPTATYRSWMLMHHRCRQPNCPKYHLYGGRGVKVCARWSERNGEGFKNFLRDLGERPAGTTLDRIDPYGDYTPENTQWATPKEQAKNKRCELERKKKLPKLIGLRFGRWVITGIIPIPAPQKPQRVVVRCNCGTERATRLSMLRNGTSRSCGCLQREVVAENNRVRAELARRK